MQRRAILHECLERMSRWKATYGDDKEYPNVFLLPRKVPSDEDSE